MDFFGIVGVLFRRWRITVSVFVIGVGLTLRLASGVGTEYESFGTVIFLPATVSLIELNSQEIFEDEANPYFHADSTRTLARTIPIVVGSSDTRLRAEEAGLSPNYELELDVVEPIIIVTSKGVTPEQSSDTLDFVLIELSHQLDDRQGITSDTPPEQRAVMEILSELRAVEDPSASLKVIGTMGIAVVLVTVMAGFAAEGVAERRPSVAVPVAS